MLDDIKSAIGEIRKQRPLILNLTNYVTMDFMANALLAIGASPIMSECEDELRELIGFSKAIHINIGTLDEYFLRRARIAAEIACELGKIVVLDPVGAGATEIRTKTSLEFLPQVDVLRSNASEVKALGGEVSKSSGVDAGDSVDEAISIAQKLSCDLDLVVAVSGPTDIVIGANNVARFPFGSEIMPLITGMGCVLTSVVAAFCSVDDNLFNATKLAVAYFVLCGEQAERESRSPGSFKVAFLDALYSPDFKFMERIISRARGRE